MTDPSSDAEAAQGRWEVTNASDADGPEAGTPIPPPAVLPSEAPVVGRRFSSSDLPPEDADRPLPRRSALSPSRGGLSSPSGEEPEHEEDETAAPIAMLPPASPAAPADDPSPAVDEATDAGAPRQGRRRRWLPLLLVVLAVALVAALVWWGQTGGTLLPRPTPTPTVDPVATYLAQPDDLTSLQNTTWTTVATVTDPSDPAIPRASCLLPASELEVTPEDTMVRTFSPTSGTTAGALHAVDRFANAEDAGGAYAALLDQLATCADQTAWFLGGHDVSGLADEATAVSYVLQEEQPEYHVLLLSRTGARINVLDVTSPDGPAPAGSVAAVQASVAARQCTDGGACPGSVEVTDDAVPPASEPPGWLADVDLPRITPGSGSWRGTDIPQVRLAGTRCEAVDLNAVASASAAQRTYLLGDDPNAPAGFGVDEAVWTFNSIDEASAFAMTLWTNTDQCPTRTTTATVARTGEFSGVGAVVLWTVTQRVDANETTARFRSAVIARDNRVVYLMANPSDTFDFTDETWSAVARRAGQRLTQLP